MNEKDVKELIYETVEEGSKDAGAWRSNTIYTKTI